jgi:hypothetical protein
VVVVLDAQVHEHVVPRLAARLRLHHDHRRRLPATDVAAGLLGRLECDHHALGEVALGFSNACFIAGHTLAFAMRLA